ncbi:bifunctional UDP-N-acetylglucosamine diphosphorylase/glucosamine-1-phosphate N-acetyltransferase GlmU [Kineosporia sp. J2-2]|uniref:Bifunctional protein GlmU n=1 Tax=Kineosporia corallincola TaxID=2835133 RepID=A0ABS5THJ0_9ACTN|nr:bifunctional UDP-N-acetylglucosamine diphosphorylase/glucosamine-1-phosphate N-acetyltransferase GlmU [Kineosporia corallincola]MBT0770557.1 bifunctional UDP-N-acetylglucosamine diphosphorylase/glucosamine-1-phosphate N-acetyltransferase GlmU [Kineosporia corallincola]
MSTQQPAAVIVLAAGEGKRMRSRTPKVLHRIGGRSLVGHALAAAGGLRPSHLVVVVRHQREQVAGHVAEIAPQAVIADQDEVPGTGSAVAAGLRAVGEVDGVVVVTYADVPLLSGETLAALVEAHRAEQAAVTVLTAEVGDPTGYGRVLRDATGAVTGIVEQRDATPQQQAIREINSGIYAFDAKVLSDALGRIGADNDQNELYLTDVLGIAHADGLRVRAVATHDLWQVEGVNDRVQLATLGAELNRRVLVAHMRAGVTVVDPASTWLDVDVRLAPDVTLLPGTQLHAGTTVETGATIGPDTTLSGCVVGEGATVVRTHGSGARIEAGAGVGPFSYLRAGTVLGPDGKIGAFVETKNATIGAGAKVPHLTYAGDATIGEGANIGAATIFANYDGVNKHHTTVGAHARVGSDTVLVAPVTVGDGAYTAAGSTITQDVPAGALAVARGRQHNSEGWVSRRRAGTPSARAAEAALAEPVAEPVAEPGTEQ